MDSNRSTQNQLFSKLYSEHSPKMMRLCKYYALSSSDAEDILHDAFIKVIQHFESCRDQQNPEAWIKRITINTALERLRKKRIFQDIDTENVQSPDDVVDNVSNEISVVDLMDKYHLTSTDVYNIVEKLPYTFKITFILYYREGFSHKEISAQIGITEKSSRANLAKSKKLIRDLLNKKLRRKYASYSSYILLTLSENDCIFLTSEHEKTWSAIVNKTPAPFRGMKFSMSKIFIYTGYVIFLGILIFIFYPEKSEKQENEIIISSEKYNSDIPQPNVNMDSYSSDSSLTAKSKEPERIERKTTSQPVEEDSTVTDTIIHRHTITVKKTIIINQ